MNFAERKIRLHQLLRFISIIAFGFLITLTFILLPYLLQTSFEYGIGAIFFVILVSYLFYSQLKSSYKDFLEILQITKQKITNANSGNNAEILVVKELQRLLPDHQIHRNFTLPEQQFDFDILLVGPSGLTVFEVKNWNKQTSFFNKTTTVTHTLNNRCYKLSKFLSTQDSELNNLDINRALIDFSGKMYHPHKPGAWIIYGLNELENYLEKRKINFLEPKIQTKLNHIFSSKIHIHLCPDKSIARHRNKSNS